MPTAHLVRPLRFVLAGCLLLAPALHGAPSQSVSVRDGERPLERCDQLDISFENRPALRAEETLQVPVGNEPFQVSSANGGIALREGSASQHDITLCKAVPEDAAPDLPAICAVVRGSSVEVTGPADRPWVGYLLVRSPRGSHVSLSATNGPIRAESFEGRLTVRTANGPIALAQVTGTVSARAENGPIRLQGDGGNVSLETQNGPIAVQLLGTQWEPGDLVVRAQNGPLSVEFPEQYQTGVEIQSAGHAPWSCQRDCGTEENASGSRRAHLGEGPTHVRLSTVNGPVKVR